MKGPEEHCEGKLEACWRRPPTIGLSCLPSGAWRSRSTSAMPASPAGAWSGVRIPQGLLIRLPWGSGGVKGFDSQWESRLRHD